ncbi:hypothetical protein DCAR_0521261 [Daucus carota subsp. sativus]|uniref:F-box associated domain-containing protein n=1 Tax=Daucus carota subsp. sativus TaxID=79200 RepID=A0AAF0X5J2_DAUCS|nr:PREDICTED: uncharacterized protein LOC108222873 isoform X1 [Daucus carota subsp. sativus]WOH01875.1 hypothetical protein DCAR_0521261 [Daucus carota subsp. sativus]
MMFESVGDDGVLVGVDLWTLDDVSDRISWTKRFSVKDDWEMWLSGYLGVGQFHGGMSFDQTWHLYDSEKKELRFYRGREYEVLATLRYTESLIVSFDGFEQVQENDTSNRHYGRSKLEGVHCIQ